MTYTFYLYLHIYLHLKRKLLLLGLQFHDTTDFLGILRHQNMCNFFSITKYPKIQLKIVNQYLICCFQSKNGRETFSLLKFLEIILFIFYLYFLSEVLFYTNCFIISPSTLIKLSGLMVLVVQLLVFLTKS